MWVSIHACVCGQEHSMPEDSEYSDHVYRNTNKDLQGVFLQTSKQTKSSYFKSFEEKSFSICLKIN